MPWQFTRPLFQLGTEYDGVRPLYHVKDLTSVWATPFFFEGECLHVW